MNISTDNKDQSVRLQTVDSLDFLNGHPALSPGIYPHSVAECLVMWMYPSCKRGHSNESNPSIYYGDRQYEEFKDLFDDKYKNDTETPNALKHIDMDYEQLYGEPWVFDHVKYKYETTFYIFTGDPYSLRDAMKQENWESYQGITGSALTFEDMVNDCAEKCRNAFGDFQQYKDFYLTEEKDNHSKNRAFLFEDCEDEEFNARGYKTLLENENYVDVSNGLMNLRWLKWFVSTSYAKDNWSYCLSGEDSAWMRLIKKLDNIPKERKEKLKV